jgi:hypothetical protein
MTERFIPDASKTHDQVIGTPTGNSWHANRKEPTCEPCRIAINAWRVAYRARGLCATGLGWPLSLRHRETPTKFRIKLPRQQQTRRDVTEADDQLLLRMQHE